jgi:hypothetical protein
VLARPSWLRFIRKTTCNARRNVTKRTTITVATESLLVLRTRGAQRVWCSRCGAEVEMIAPGTPLTSSILRDVQQLLESGQLHQFEAADGSARLCLNSLLAFVRKTKTHKPR